jgi:hypothetical protein
MASRGDGSARSGMTRPGNNNGNVRKYALDTELGQGFQWLPLE